MEVKHDFDRLGCPVCGRYYRDKEIVLVDEMNTVIHPKCFDTESAFFIKDSGSYREIVDRYAFFSELHD
jgi:hypothetical protein